MAIRRLGVLGWPVAHSRSPAMHNAALAALGLGDAWRYQLLPVPPDRFAETVAGLHDAGFAGANVTIPHKEAARALATDVTAAARAIGAANTLTFGPNGEIQADNTDAPGLIAALGGPGEVAGRTALVLGAGGSARAAVWALREAGAADVAVWNRTPARAAALAADFGVRAVFAPGAADLLVHCTSVGLNGEDAAAALGLAGPSAAGDTQVPGATSTASARGGLARYGTVVDLVYTAGGTPLLRAASAAGCATVDGLEVLVQQGALSLQRWTGQAAPLEVMREAAAAVP